MTPITQPYVFPYSGLVPSDKGITGIVIIAESHLSIHSFEEKGYSFIDIFSCKDFDTEKAIQITLEMFKPESYEINTVKRGLDFPRD
jgi:S-adenosylmethionine decarboxylase